MSKTLRQSELILNSDGSVYHLKLRPEHIAPIVFLVGDQSRVARISAHFDRIEHIVQRREFLTHTGIYKGTPVTALSTGIGTDNIDIVLNELDAAVNIDLQTRRIKEERISLDLIRIGTSGGLQEDIPVGSFIVSEFGLGFDGLLHYYNYPYSDIEQELMSAVHTQLQWPETLARPYVTAASSGLLESMSRDMIRGITATAPGFYGPQGRGLFLAPKHPLLNERLTAFMHQGLRITNLEMETSALYGLGNLLGHRCLTCCAIIANRIRQEFSDDAQGVMDTLIEVVLDGIVKLQPGSPPG